MRKLELLAPAKDLACGLAAIDHGADAVYIGGPGFGARAAAGNSLDDIAALCRHAHRYGARVYVTVNTIIYEDELAAAQELVTALSHIGVDALLVQDMATLTMRRVALSEVGRAPALHASTQCDNRTAEKVRWLRALGFTRAVLARELSTGEVRAIHEAVPDMELEVFVHGALCVSYSGQCYASQQLLGRSANRGECAQVCRMKFDLLDADGKAVVRDRYLLSMHDLCLIDHLEELADAGAVSFKIEGRLKDADYVKNVVAAYSRRLDAIVSRRPADYCRASWGRVEDRQRVEGGKDSAAWQPNLNKTFNRGYTTYFNKGRQRDLCTMFTPKALGEFVGHVKELRRDSFTVAGTASFANGDGLCFINDDHELEGFRVNRADKSRLWPYRMPRGLRPGLSLYRNNDVAFAKALAADTTRRVIPVDITFAATADGFSLTMALPSGSGPQSASVSRPFAHETAQRPQGDNIRRQLSRLGNTAYEAASVTVAEEAAGLFVPSSLLAEMRREAVAMLDGNVQSYCDLRLSATKREDVAEAAGGDTADAAINGRTQNGGTPKGEREETLEGELNGTLDGELKGTLDGEQDGMPDGHDGEATEARYWSREYREHPYLFNIANHIARDFYRRHGLDIAETALEVSDGKVTPYSHPILMQCRYCLRYELGYCVRRGGKKPMWREPLELRLGDGHRFRLDFRCDECQMNVVAE